MSNFPDSARAARATRTVDFLRHFERRGRDPVYAGMHERALFTVVIFTALTLSAGAQSKTAGSKSKGTESSEKKENAAVEKPEKTKAVPIRATDNLTIELLHPEFDAPKIDSTYVVSAKGTIKMPRLAQEIEAAGLTFKEMEKSIEDLYRTGGIYEDPVFSVSLAANCCPSSTAHVVAVGGEVRSPQGTVPLREGTRLYQAVMSAGGFTEFANRKRVKIIRGTGEKIYNLERLPPDEGNNPLLKDGDTVHVAAGNEPPAAEAKQRVARVADQLVIELKRPREDALNVSSVYPVSSGGTIKMPYLGDEEVKVAGLALGEIQEVLERTYHAAGIYDKPDFTVAWDRHSACERGCSYCVAVGGEVKSPQGAVPLPDGMRLYQAIMAVGGPTEFADLRRVKIIRPAGGILGVREIKCYLRIQDAVNNPLLEDGDTIWVPSDDEPPGSRTADDDTKVRGAGDRSGNTARDPGRLHAALANEADAAVGGAKVGNGKAGANGFLPRGKISGHAPEQMAEWEIFPSVAIYDAHQETAGSIPLGMNTGLFEAIVRAGYAPSLENAGNVTLTRGGQETRYKPDDIKPGGSIDPGLEWGDVIIVGSGSQ